MKPTTVSIVITTNHANKTISVSVDGEEKWTSQSWTDFDSERESRLFAKAVALDHVNAFGKTIVTYNYEGN